MPDKETSNPGRESLFTLTIAIAFAIVVLSAVALGNLLASQVISINSSLNILFFLGGILFGGISLWELIEIALMERIENEIRKKRR